MSVITQNYDIDLKATGEFPVVKMSQFDTGSRTIVFTVYDGHDLANIDGMVARVDGTRSDGVEFSSTCTVSAGSKVSFTISQEMTKHAGKHAAELVIFDANGNPAGTQNFIIEVEAATMVRDSAASADDRTLYDQFTDSVSKTVADKMASVDSKLASVDSKMAGVDTKISTTVDNEIDKRIKPDPLLGAWSDYTVEGTASFTDGWTKQIIPLKIKSQSDGASAVYGSNTSNSIYIYKPGVYQLMMDGWYGSDVEITGRSTWLELVSNSDPGNAKRGWTINSAQGIGAEGGKYQLFRGAVTFYVPDAGLPYRLNVYTAGASAVTLQISSLSQMVITRISSGSDILEQGVNTLSIGTTTTGEPGTQASVTNSGTAKDVVLDFTIPRGADGTGGGSSYTLPPATASTLGGVKIGSGISVASDGTISASGGSGGLTLETITAGEPSLYNSLAGATVDVSHLKFYKYGALVGCRGYFSIMMQEDYSGNITTNDLYFRVSSSISNGFQNNGIKTVGFVSTEEYDLMRHVTDVRPLWFHINQNSAYVSIEIPGVNFKAKTTYYFQVDAVTLYFGVDEN